MDLYELTPEQAQRILPAVAQARDGLITKGEMADRIEDLVIDGGQLFEN
jgi:hypothetical protein